MFPKPILDLKPNTYAFEVNPLIKPTGFREYDARWWYGVRVVVAGLLVWFWRRYEELHAVAGVPVAHWLLSIAVGIGVFVVWINLDFSPLAFPGSGGFDPRSEGQIDWPLVAVRLSGAALLVPVMEELF